MTSNFQNPSSTPNFQKEDSTMENTIDTGIMSEEAIKLSTNDERLLALGEGIEGLNARIIETPKLVGLAAQYPLIATLGKKEALAYDTAIFVCNPVRKRGVRPGQTDESGKAIQVFNRTQFTSVDRGGRWKLNCHYHADGVGSLLSHENLLDLDVASAGYRWDVDLDFLEGINPAWKAFNEKTPDGSPLVLVVAHVVSRTKFSPYQFAVNTREGKKTVKGHVSRVRVSYAELYLLPAVFQKEEKATRGKLGALKNGMANAVQRGAEELDKNKAGRAGKFLLD